MSAQRSRSAATGEGRPRSGPTEGVSAATFRWAMTLALTESAPPRYGEQYPKVFVARKLSHNGRDDQGVLALLLRKATRYDKLCAGRHRNL